MDLVSSKVLLVASVTAQNSQAVLAQQVSGVSVSLLKVSPDVWVEGGPEVTDLQHRHTESRSKYSAEAFPVAPLESDLADIRHLSRFVSVLHMPEEGRLTVKIHLTDLTRHYRENQHLLHNADICGYKVVVKKYQVGYWWIIVLELYSSFCTSMTCMNVYIVKPPV